MRSLFLALLYLAVAAVVISSAVTSVIPQPLHKLTDPGYCDARDVTPPQRRLGSRKASVYPPEAVRENEEGTTTLDYRIDTLGKAGDIKVARSSGYPILDQAAVTQTLTESYDSATLHGHPIACRKLERIVWKLTDDPQPLSYANVREMGPNDYPPRAKANGEQGTTEIQVVIDQNGKIINSSIIKSSGYGDLDIAAMGQLYAGDKIAPAALSAKPIATVATFEFHWSLASQNVHAKAKER